jgi:hypothetical protein
MAASYYGAVRLPRSRVSMMKVPWGSAPRSARQRVFVPVAVPTTVVMPGFRLAPARNSTGKPVAA